MNSSLGAADKVQRLRALAALAEHLDLVQAPTWMLTTIFNPLGLLRHQMYRHCTHIHISKYSTHKIQMNKNFNSLLFLGLQNKDSPVKFGIPFSS